MWQTFSLWQHFILADFFSYARPIVSDSILFVRQNNKLGIFFLPSFSFSQPKCGYPDKALVDSHLPTPWNLYYLTYVIGLHLLQWYGWQCMVLSNVFETFHNASKLYHHIGGKGLQYETI